MPVRAIRGLAVCVVLIVMLAAHSPALSQPAGDEEKTRREMAALAWQRGPTEARIGGTATLKVEDGQAFLDGPNTRRFLELNGNPPRDDHCT